ncbi:MAG: YegS/Rv2252/BmrU family lipid kinase [Clostridia bacterium]|nr:YegS/Rv2252/BmrU family lipid kinase [Clostridia bacterium]
MKAKSALFDIVQIFCENGLDVSVTVTSYAGHATEIAENLDESYDIVACAGGDGTLNEVIAGVLRGGRNVPIGYIPCGSTNDFASTIGLSKDLGKAALDIATGKEVGFDIGRFGDRYFSYVASFGAFTKASYSAPQGMKNVLGHAAYILEGIKDIPSIKSEHVKVEIDDGRVYENDYIFGAITNTTSVGGILTLDKTLVTLNDGKFEMLLVKKPKNIGDLTRCISALLSQKTDCDMFDFCELSKAKITTAGPLAWSLDGEKADSDIDVTIENLHTAVRVILPEKAAEDALFNE